MNRAPNFTQAQVRRAVKAAEEDGFVVTAINVNTMEVEKRPMTEREKIAARPIITVEEAAALAKCTSVEQFRLMVKEGIFPAGVNNRKWDRRKLEPAVTRAHVTSDTKSEYSEIYFLEVGEYIKIGFSTGVYSRIASMQTGSPYEIKLIGTIKGSIRNEEELHRRLAHIRHRGEWFQKTKGLLAYIDWLKARAVK